MKLSENKPSGEDTEALKARVDNEKGRVGTKACWRAA